MSNSKPCLGYPSKAAAVLALLASGKTHAEIAVLVGGTPQSVKANIRDARKLADRNTGGPGIWTPEKIDKARRLFGKTMILIADALQVPAGELLTYALDGKVPPMGRNGRIGDLRNASESRAVFRDDRPQEETEPVAPPVSQIALPAPPAPSRDDDEAELARLEAETSVEPEPPPAVAPTPARPRPASAAAGTRYRLIDPDGAGFVHESLDGVTTNRRYAWCGTRKQLDVVIALHPKLRRYELETVI